MSVVLVLTLIFDFAIAAVSYALVEAPCRQAMRRWGVPQIQAAQVWVYAVVTRRPMPKSRVAQTRVFGAQRPMLRTLHD